jgi:hypothetical protein
MSSSIGPNTSNDPIFVIDAKNIKPVKSSVNPSSINNLQLWVDASEIDNITLTAGNEVTQVIDKSSNGYIFTSTTNPVWISSGFGSESKPYFHFSGDSLVANGEVFDMTKDMTIFVAIQPEVATNGTIFSTLNGGNGYSMRALDTDEFRHTLGSSSGQDTIVDDVTVEGIYRSYFTRSSNSLRTYQQGCLKNTRTMGGATGNDGNLTLGRFTGGSFPLTGKIAEMIYYDRLLTDDENRELERYFHDKYGVYPKPVLCETDSLVSRDAGELINGVIETDDYWEFDGVNDYVDFGDNLDIGTSDWSMEFWINLPNSNTSRDWFISKAFAAVGTNRWAFGLDGTRQLRSFFVGSPQTGPEGSVILCDTQLDTNTWYHVTVVYDRAIQQRVYLNTVLESFTNDPTGDRGDDISIYKIITHLG